MTATPAPRAFIGLEPRYPETPMTQFSDHEMTARRNAFAASRLSVPFRFKPLSFKGFLVATTAFLSPMGPNGPISLAHLVR